MDLASHTGTLATRRLEADLPTIPSGLRGEGALGHPHASLPLHKMWKAVGKVGEQQKAARGLAERPTLKQRELVPWLVLPADFWK
jgi:hypothetical protein